jgi:hypothetical protein
MKNIKSKFSLKFILPLLTFGLFLLYYYYGIPIFYFKLIIIIILLSLNVYFLLKDRKTFQEDALVSSFPASSLNKRHFYTIATIGGLFSSYLAIKSDNRAGREKVLANIEKQNNLAKENYNTTIIKLQGEKTELSAQSGRAAEHIKNSNFHVLNMDNRFLFELRSKKTPVALQEEDKTQMNDLENFIKLDLDNLTTKNETILKENPNFLDSNSENKIEDSKTSPNSENDNINKSFIFSGIFEKFESLDTYSKLALSLLLSKSVLVSSLVSMAFVFYGDYLIKRFNLETRYPKLYEIINLRKKFNRYYLILNITTIIIVILAEVIFSIAILNL